MTFCHYKFTQNAKIRMVFDLNTLFRNEDGSWNSDNAKEIILFAKGHEMELDWQMGNEPNSFFYVFNISVSAEQWAKDYCELCNMLNDLGYQDSILGRPEANHMGDERNSDPKVFERLLIQIQTVSESIKLSNQNLPMWISETSSAFGGGAPELSDRFVAGFLWLDKLGISAKMGVQTVIRQSLFGGNYAMIGPDLEPNPDWWVAVLYKQFISEKVLDLKMPNGPNDVRLYAHCSAQKDVVDNSSMVTIYGMNLNTTPRNIYISHLSEVMTILSYILTSDNLQSRNIYLNNIVLKLKDNGELPYFKPKLVNRNGPIILPPYSMVFLLINNTKISACL